MRNDSADTFRHDLTRLINRCSLENASNTPDFILAQFLAGCLAAFDTAVQQRETWHGRDARPAPGPLPTTGLATGETRVCHCCADARSGTEGDCVCPSWCPHSTTYRVERGNHPRATSSAAPGAPQAACPACGGNLSPQIRADGTPIEGSPQRCTRCFTAAEMRTCVGCGGPTAQWAGKRGEHLSFDDMDKDPPCCHDGEAGWYWCRVTNAMLARDRVYREQRRALAGTPPGEGT